MDFSEWDFDFAPKSEPLRDDSYFQKVSVPETYLTIERMFLFWKKPHNRQSLPMLQREEEPEKVHEILDERTNPTWPTTRFAPRLSGSGAFREVYDVMNNWGPTTARFPMATSARN